MGRGRPKTKKPVNSFRLMNAEIARFPTYLLTDRGTLTEIPLTSTDEYNHARMQLHHFVPKSDYDTNISWYKEHGIEQKLILMPITTHEQVHQQAVKNLSDDDFLYKYGISRWDLVYNRRYSK